MASKIALVDLDALRKHIATPQTKYEQEYLIGFRGVLVIQAFLWMFLQTFAPATVYASSDVYGPHAQVIVRKIFSVLFWNEYFLYGAAIFLSARSIAIPFFRDPTPATIARTLLTRSISLCIPVAICMAIVKGAITDDFLNIITQYKANTGNQSLPIPYQLPTTLSYWNSVFNLFWTSHGWQSQAASYAFPTQTLWLINAIYIQSYTVYMTMVIVPHTRPRWRVQFGVLFVVAAWWCNSWAWYTISGLLMCDMVMHMNFKENALQGMPIQFRGLAWRRKTDGQPHRIPTWVFGGVLMFGGLLMQYLWATYRPDLFYAEWRIHSNPYTTAGLNEDYMVEHTASRDDVYITIMGFFFLLETYEGMQRALQSKVLLYLGRRSLSYFLLQSIFTYVVGIRAYEGLRARGVTHGGSVVVTLITCLVVIIPLAELFHRLIVVPSRYLSHNFHEFIIS